MSEGRARSEVREKRPDGLPGVRLLLIDTCGVEGSLALAEGSLALGEPWDVAAEERLPGRSASELLLPTLRGMLERVGWRVQEMSAVAVVHGPGSFTGLRVGVSAAKGLSEGGEAPLIGISRLAVLAGAAEGASGRVHAMLDAGRGEVFYGAYGRGETVWEELLTTDEALRVIEAEGGTAVVCEPRLAELVRAASVLTVNEPTAAGALEIAVEQLRVGQFAEVAGLDGHYLRRTETEIRQRLALQERVRSGGAIG